MSHSINMYADTPVENAIEPMPEVLTGGACHAGLDILQYLGIWEIHEPSFNTLYANVASLDLANHVQANLNVNQAQVAAKQNSIDSGHIVFCLEMRGVLTKNGSSQSTAGSTVLMRRTISQAARDPSIDAIVLAIDSPGGTVAGIEELTQAVAEAAKHKPVWAFVEDMCASAAYRVASQATRIVANNQNAFVGSIGTYVAMYDTSEMAAKEGIRPVVIKAGEHKGAGIPGTKITDEQISKWQTIVDSLQKGFTQDVANGRSVPLAQVSHWADGDIHQAADAIGLGLIDSIESWGQFTKSLENELSTQKPKGGAMSTDTITTVEQTATPPAPPVVATIQELEQSCKGATPEFYLAQLKANATIEQAKNAWMAEQVTRLEAAEKRAVEAEEKNAKAEEKNDPTGNQPLGTEEPAKSTSGDFEAEWKSLVAANVTKGMTKQKAITAANRDNPELREAMVEAVNAAR